MINCIAVCDRCEARFQDGTRWEDSDCLKDELEEHYWETEENGDGFDLHYCPSCVALRRGEVLEIVDDYELEAEGGIDIRLVIALVILLCVILSVVDKF